MAGGLDSLTRWGVEVNAHLKRIASEVRSVGKRVGILEDAVLSLNKKQEGHEEVEPVIGSLSFGGVQEAVAPAEDVQKSITSAAAMASVARRLIETINVQNRSRFEEALAGGTARVVDEFGLELMDARRQFELRYPDQDVAFTLALMNYVENQRLLRTKQVSSQLPEVDEGARDVHKRFVSGLLSIADTPNKREQPETAMPDWAIMLSKSIRRSQQDIRSLAGSVTALADKLDEQSGQDIVLEDDGAQEAPRCVTCACDDDDDLHNMTVGGDDCDPCVGD